MRAIELFAGVGGFRIGLDRANIETVWANEWDKYAAATYRYRFGDIDTRDIATVPADDIPEHDIICGGFPCQAFSIAGKRRGFEDTRGTLFFEIMRIARHHRTPYLFLENVKGLLNHDSSRTFETIIRTMEELGYGYQWQVCNSKDFGVPQNRERVFIVGHLRGKPRPQVFPVGEADGIYTETEADRKGIHAATLTARQYANWEGNFVRVKSATKQGYEKAKVHTTNTGGVKVGFRIRRFTPKECERLQGFPDDWTKYGTDESGKNFEQSDAQRYKMMGNAVTVNVVEAIATKLKKGLRDE